MRYSRMIAATGALLVCGLLAACSGVGASSAAPSATSPAAPATADGLGIFTAFDRCQDDPEPPADADPDAGYVLCRRAASDPRMTGDYRVVSYGPAEDPLDTTDPPLATLWGSGTVTNADGSWDCKELLQGTMENGVGWRDQICVGLGDYVGLTAYMHGITGDIAMTVGMLGWIEKSH
jgi:hypothetical protein